MTILTIIAAIALVTAIIAGLAWINYQTGGKLGWIFLPF